ncbi:hypothetical protein CFP56_040068 [Quercus suber]|uniref:Uncharacterized protein n=1 Tax=Quercus suber TaxID=58331 RepID=A0AAW0LMC2_QUESU
MYEIIRGFLYNLLDPVITLSSGRFHRLVPRAQVHLDPISSPRKCVRTTFPVSSAYILCDSSLR